MDTADLEHWLTLFHLPGMSARLFAKLIEVFDSPAGALRADPRVLERAGLSAELVATLREWRGNGDASALARRVQEALEWHAAPGQTVLALSDTAYPPRLKAIPDPPPLLFVRGDPTALLLPQLALVGSRTPTAGGRRLARRFAAQLGRAGYAITSGLALGIDGESHLGALEAGVATVAVLGTGVDRVYPRSHQALAGRILAEGGALVSEFPLGMRANPWHFPQRNRVISGLAVGVLVVEAALPSGSLVTARCALEQGRDVFALPGSIDNPRVRGCHHLIREGAVLVQAVDDILVELGDLLPPARAPAMDEREEEGVEGSAALVLPHIGHDRVTLDQLLPLTGLAVGELSAALVQLEISGRVEAMHGGWTLRSRA